MKAKLILERMKDSRLLERREGYSRSFIKGLIDLLYLSHAQLVNSAPYTAAKIALGATLSLAQEKSLGMLRVAAPGGYGHLMFSRSSSEWGFLAGHLIGIVVGSDGAPPAPTDHAMKQAIFHGQNGALAPGIVDSYDTGDDQNSSNTYDSSKVYTPVFLPARGFRFSSAWFKMWRTGNPGTLDIELYNLTRNSGSGESSFQINVANLDGNAISNVSPGDFYEAVFAPVDLYPDCWYRLSVSAPAGNSTNKINVRQDASGPNHVRWRGSSDTGSITLFRLSGSANPELLYGGCELYGMNIAHPNGSFSIRRIFTNASGEAVTVNSCGIYACAQRYVYSSGPIWTVYPYCIARDIVSPGITLNNGEILAVTYIPQITV